MLSSFGNVNIAIILIALLVSMVIHEFMHAYVGHLLGDTTAQDQGRLTLNPLKHIDPFMTILLPLMSLALGGPLIMAARPVPFNPSRVKFDEFGAALLAAAGPLSNLVLAFVGATLADRVLVGTPFWSNAFWAFAVLNVSLFIFNSVPIPPLDGSRVLYAFAPEPVQDFMRAIEPYGLFIIFALVLFGGLSGFLVNIENSILHLLP